MGIAENFSSVVVPVVEPKGDVRRRIGLLSYPSPPEGWGMLFRDARSITTVGMQYPIDVVFLRGGVVIDVQVGVPPGRGEVTTATGSADTVLELGPGAAVSMGVRVGGRVSFRPIS